MIRIGLQRLVGLVPVLLIHAGADGAADIGAGQGAELLPDRHLLGLLPVCEVLLAEDGRRDHDGSDGAVDPVVLDPLGESGLLVVDDGDLRRCLVLGHD